MSRPTPVRSLAFVALALATAGCEDFSRFSTTKGEAYCGAVTLASDFRQGLSPRMQMSLTLDATDLDGPRSPGRMTTFEPSDQGGLGQGERMFDDAPLRVIAAIEHDPLSRLTFGDGRDRSAIYAVSPADAEAVSMLAVLSLMHDDSAQIRLMRPGQTGKVGGDEGQIYGLFQLGRRPGGCGF